jgi:hypothetical protein
VARALESFVLALPYAEAIVGLRPSISSCE